MSTELDFRGGRGPRRLDHRAVSELLARRDLNDITMAQIAAHAGVAKPTLYKLAGSKQELVDACLDAEVERLVGYLHECCADTGDESLVLTAVARFASDSPGGFALLFEQRTHGATARIRRAESGLAGLLRGARDPEIVAAAALGGAAAAVSRWTADRLGSGQPAQIDVVALRRAIGD